MQSDAELLRRYRYRLALQEKIAALEDPAQEKFAAECVRLRSRIVALRTKEDEQRDTTVCLWDNMVRLRNTKEDAMNWWCACQVATFLKQQHELEKKWALEREDKAAHPNETPCMRDIRLHRGSLQYLLNSRFCNVKMKMNGSWDWHPLCGRSNGPHLDFPQQMHLYGQCGMR